MKTWTGYLEDTDQATAQLNNGTMEIIVPIPERKDERKEIPVR
jgi:HSP20 family molecular chaperone IbpA